MKRKEIKLLHSKSSQELTKELNSKIEERNKLQLEYHSSPPKNKRNLRTLNDDIARIATVLRQHPKKLEDIGAAQRTVTPILHRRRVLRSTHKKEK